MLHLESLVNHSGRHVSPGRCLDSVGRSHCLASPETGQDAHNKVSKKQGVSHQSNMGGQRGKIITDLPGEPINDPSLSKMFF